MSASIPPDPNYPIRSSSLRSMEGSSELYDTPKPLQPSSVSEKPKSFMEDMMASFSSLLKSFADSQMENFAEYLGNLAVEAEDFDAPVCANSHSRFRTAPRGRKGDKNLNNLGHERFQADDDGGNNPLGETNEKLKAEIEVPKDTFVGTIVNSHDSYKNHAKTINIYQYK